MNRFRYAALAAAAVASAGCYRLTVVATDAPVPTNARTLDKPWAHSFVYGLVPPSPVTAGATCPTGVQQVVTQRSFLNSLVGGLTYSLYTPMRITVTCAGDGTRSSGLTAPDSATTPSAVASAAPAHQDHQYHQ